MLSMLGRVFAISTLVLTLVAVSQWYTINKYKDELVLALTGKALQESNVIALEGVIDRQADALAEIKADYKSKLQRYRNTSAEAIAKSVNEYKALSEKLAASTSKDTHVKDCINTHSTIDAIRSIGL